jgi:Skp family chaperone for outer membrane proteins
MKKTISAVSILLLLTAFGCTKHQVETRSQVEVAPVEVKPIHITIDVNIRVDRALDDFFSDIDDSAKEIK